MGGVSDLVAFLRGMPSNLRVMVARSSVTSFVYNLNPYSSLYIIALGATGTQLGLLNSLSLAMSMTFTLLTGWVSDRTERKAVFLIGSFIALLVPLIYGAAWSWTLLLPAFALGGLADGIIQPAWGAMYANSVSNRKRGTVYGLVNVFVLIPILFAGLIGGVIVSSSGGLTAVGIRPLYWLQFVLLVTTWLFVLRYLKKEERPTRAVPRSLRGMDDDYRGGPGSWGGRPGVL
ncbi:MFS transporter, partial [Candidatus Bathyarchaeota archaeon]|nr:MFS transporter [Candidatus Bathyarchaeota archaeon]